MEKVSILTPCYNSEIFIHRLLDSVLNQSYSNIEMIIVDDGSTDDSIKVIESYIPKFLNKGFTLQFLSQNNQGQASAINKGLKQISGEFLIWPDSDDFYSNTKSIEKMVKIFRNNSDVSVVRCMSSLIDEQTLKSIRVLGNQNKKINKSNNLFEDCLFEENNFWFGAGNYMIKTRVLDIYYPDREIYTSNKFGGQNWQLLLPSLYNKICVTIHEPLYNILERNNSHSRTISNNIDNLILKYNEHERIILKTLEYIKDMRTDEFSYYKEKVKMKYIIIRIKTLLSFNKYEKAKNEYKKHKDQIDIRERLLINLKFIPYINKLRTLFKVSTNE